jgi:Flp pilus assembly protein TadB
MARPLPGKLAHLHWREARARKAAYTCTTLDAHIRAIEAAAGKLTPEQADRLRAQLRVPADTVERRAGDLHVVVAGTLVTLAIIGLTGFIVVRLNGSTPVIAAVFTALAAVLATVPSIIKALRRP